jgi:autotransporter-associated beta strand protein
MSGVTGIEAGHTQSLFLKSDGSVWATGDNIYGQLGDGTFVSKTTPTPMLNPSVYAAVISGSGGLVVSGSGAQVFAGLNTYTGVTTLSGGILSIDSLANGGLASELGAASSASSNLVFAGGTLLYTGTAAASTDRGLTLSGTTNGTINVPNAVNLTLSGPIVGTGGFTETGYGTIVLSGTNTFTGKTTVTSGILSVLTLNKVVGVAASSSLGAPTTAANGTIDLGGLTSTATLLITGTVQTTDRVINLAGTTGGVVIDQSGSGALVFSSALTATGAGSKTLTLQGSTAGTGQLSGAIVDNSVTNKTALWKQGTGKWTLFSANTHSGERLCHRGPLS